MALRTLILFSLLCLLLLGGVAFWLHRDPQALATHLAEEIQQRTGIQCTLGTVDVVLLPVPSLGISDLRMHTPELEFSVAFATVRPALWPLLRGQFAPGSVTLLRPRVQRTLPGTAQPPPPAPLPPATTTAAPAASTALTELWPLLYEAEKNIPETLYGMNLYILHGALHSALPQEKNISIDNISTDITMIPGGLTGSISLGQTLLRQGQEVVFSLDALHLELEGQLLRMAQGADAGVRLDTRLHIPGVTQNLHLKIHATQRTSLGEHTPHVQIQTDVNGGLLWEGVQSGPPAVIPLSIQAKGKGSVETGMQLEDIRIGLAQDRLRGQAFLTLRGAARTIEPRLDGTLDIQRLSLSQWFGFGRRLPPGLQHTLHQIEGTLRFAVTTQGLDVPHIAVRAADGLFTGKGSVPLWAQPVITLDLAAPSLTLGKAFPEAEGQSPAALAFAHAPLTPEPGSDAAKALAGPSINYDINLRVGNLEAWRMQVGDVSFRCIPAVWGADADRPAGQKSLPKNAESSVLMTFGTGQLYGGRGEGQLLLTTPAPGKTGYGVKAALRNVSMEQLLPRLAAPAGKTVAAATGIPSPVGGRLNLDTEFTAQGRTLPAFFASQDGTLALRLDNGYFLYDANKKEKTPFTRFRLDARVRGGDQSQTGQTGQTSRPNRLPAEVSYTGQWKVGMDAPRLKASLQMEGPIAFSSRQLLPMQWRKVPGHLMLEADKSLLAEWGWLPAPGGNVGGDTEAQGPRRLDISGRFSLHSGEKTFAVEDAQASLPDMGSTHVRGHLQGAAPPQGVWLDGTLEGSTASARSLLRVFAPSIVDSLPSTTLHRGEGKARLTYKDKSLALTDMRIKVDTLTATGGLSGVWKEKPAWKFDMDVDTLDMDVWMPARKAAASGKKAQTPPPWKLDWMREMDVQGQLRIQNLRVRKFTLQQARIPVQLRNAALECAPVRGDLYGAPLAASFKGEYTSRGLKLHLTTEAKGVDMRRLSEDRAMSTLLTGQGALWASVLGTARSGADIPAALDGSWSLHISDANTLPRQAKSPASRTQLGDIRASGPLEKGVLRCDNLTIAGTTMQARGGGWVNLDKDTLDVSMTVNMYRIPEFPVRFYGSLDDPQRSINAGKAIANTLGNLGSEVVDVLGNVIGGALRILP